jgi:hypothetical protein
MPGGSQDFGVPNVANGLGLHHMCSDSMLTVLGRPGDGLRPRDPHDSSWFPSPEDAFRGMQPLRSIGGQTLPMLPWRPALARTPRHVAIPPSPMIPSVRHNRQRGFVSSSQDPIRAL